MQTKRYRNDGPTSAKFKIYGQPGMAPVEFDVAPGEECDIPVGYCQGTFLKRRAPGLVSADSPRKESESKIEAKESKPEEPKRKPGRPRKKAE